MEQTLERRDRILIVDDEEMNCELLETYLELLGYETEMATSGTEALEKIGPHIDLVLLDIAMPAMNGFEVTTRLRQHPEYADIPIIIVTAFSSKEDRLKAVEAGANDFITKPIDETELRVRTSSLLKFKHSLDSIKAHRAELARLATTDMLTGLPNHRALVSELDSEVNRCIRYERCFSLLFVDVDHFKTLNDGHGHAAGDVALTEFGAIIRHCLRSADTVGRWGGEEFLVILPESDSASAMNTAERIRRTVAEHTFQAIGRRQITCSIGVASFPDDGMDRPSLVEAADRGMYTAKRLGRNQVRNASDPAVHAFMDSVDAMPAHFEMDLRGVVEAMAMLVAARDRYTGQHVLDTTLLTIRIAAQMGVLDLRSIEWAGKLHDIGKVAISDAILQKQDMLTSDEWEEMKQHPVVGAEVLSHIPTLRVACSGIRSHHENWDGTGYPDGLAGEDIPLAGRIVAVADAYGAMTTTRPYKRAHTLEWAIEELKRCAGTQFDPAVVEALEQVLRTQTTQETGSQEQNSMVEP